MDQINYVLLETILALFLAAVVAVAVSKLQCKKLKLPPGLVPIPVFGNWLQVGNNLDHKVLAGMARKLGDLFLLRMGTRNLVIVSSPELAKEVLLNLYHTCPPHPGAEFGSRTRNIVFDIFSGNEQDMVFASYGEHWRKMRRIATAPFFSSKAVREHRTAWEDEAARLVEGLKSAYDEASVGVDMKMRIQLLSHNNMYRMMFGRRFESVEDPLFSKLYGLNSTRNMLAHNLAYNYGDFIPALRPFIRGYLKICKEVSHKRLELYNYFVQERNNVGRSSLVKAGIDPILHAEKIGEITQSNVLHLIENMNTAGIDTIARSIEWAVADLANHPRVFNKLQLELDDVLGRGVQITEPDMQRLPYLQAVIKETFRLRMAAPLLVPHMNLKDAKLGGYDIPAESRVTINGWWLANNPAHWKRPEEFRPERFLEEESHVEITGNDFRYLPFGAGRRSCPGITLSMPIFCITLGRLVQNFDFLIPPGKEKIDTTEKTGQFSLHISNPFTILMRPR